MRLTARLIRHILLPAVILAVFIVGAYRYYNRQHAEAAIQADLERAGQVAVELLELGITRYSGYLASLLEQEELNSVLLLHEGISLEENEPVRRKLETACSRILQSANSILSVELFDNSGNRMLQIVRPGNPPPEQATQWIDTTGDEARFFLWEGQGVGRVVQELTNPRGADHLYASLTLDFEDFATPIFNLASRGLGAVSVAVHDEEETLRGVIGDPLVPEQIGPSGSFSTPFCRSTLRFDVPVATIDEEVAMYEDQVVLIIGLIFFVLICSIWVGLRDNVLFPVEVMIQVAEAFERGEETPGPARVRHTGDELDVLDQSLRSAADTSFKAQHILNTLNKTLEQRVDERTQDMCTALEAADAANNAKSEFLANISHELRTPLNGILGMTYPLVDDPLTESQQAAVKTIRSSGSDLLRIIDDILDISKIEAGKLTVEYSAFDLRESLREVAALLDGSAQAKGLELQLDVGSRVPMNFISDPGRFRQVMVNLVSNGIKFTEVGYVRIRASLDADEQTTLCVAVEDTGIGIAEDKLDAIFGAFNQADSSSARRFGGTGLGLSISRQLAEALGGELAVESAAGRGSTFSLRLPLRMERPNSKEVASALPAREDKTDDSEEPLPEDQVRERGRG